MVSLSKLTAREILIDFEVFHRIFRHLPECFGDAASGPPRSWGAVSDTGAFPAQLMRLYEMNYQKCRFCTCLKNCDLAKIRLAAKFRAAWPRSLQQGSAQQDSGFNTWTSLIVLQSWWLMLMFDYFNHKEHLTNHSRHFFPRISLMLDFAWIANSTRSHNKVHLILASGLCRFMLTASSTGKDHSGL